MKMKIGKDIDTIIFNPAPLVVGKGYKALK